MNVISKIKSIILDFRIAHVAYDLEQTKTVVPQGFPPRAEALKIKKSTLTNLTERRRALS